MARAGVYNFKPYKRGDTLLGVNMQVKTGTGTLVPADITGYNIRVDFREESRDGDLIFSLRIGSGITIINALSGQFIVGPKLLDVPVGKYFYDIEFTLPDGTVRTWVEGTLQVTQDVTL